ncbi:hypothetical protein PDIG_78550 [Penicillium digitatum PHI26]|uniref:Ubiquitin-like domain-containing protein n=1 Tax=Penicillium digitatum (strain PHI26 / CECT 20796) TaxID=1170229 RepID=K9FD43_PEND2|nr:hypothetical protein PDIG_78550 [Penicillium digitatum PHI26]
MASPKELTVHHCGIAHIVQVPASATLQDLSSELERVLNIPIDNQKLLIAPKPGMQKAPFPPTLLDAILQTSSPKFKITLLGTPAKAIADLHEQSANEQRRQESRAAALSAARRNKQTPSSSRSGGIHTISSSSLRWRHPHHLILIQQLHLPPSPPTIIPSQPRPIPRLPQTSPR